MNVHILEMPLDFGANRHGSDMGPSAIRLAGIKVKDFMSFIRANQLLDSLYRISKKCNNLNTQEQLVFLMEAEKVFEAFDKIPTLVWEDEYRKYSEVLNAYKDIRIARWGSEIK